MAQRSFEAPAMGPEAKLLLCVARITLEAQDRERIARRNRGMARDLVEFPVEPVSDDLWWKSLPTARMEGVEVRRFAPREQSLILCLHGSKHFWGSLGWLVDIAELIKQDPRSDWEWIIARAASRVEWTRWPLPRALFFLYAPLRLARLTGKYVAKAAKGA